MISGMDSPTPAARRAFLTIARMIAVAVAFALITPTAFGDESTGKETPAVLFKDFLAAHKAQEQGKASEIARKLIQQRERAQPLIPQLLEFIKELPAGKHLAGTEFSYRDDAAEVLASIGAPAALALAGMISEGDAKVSQQVTYVVPKGTHVIGAKSYNAADDELYPSAMSFSRFKNITHVIDRLAVEALPAVPKLIKLLDSRSAEIRAEACRCLAPIGPMAGAALPRIQTLCKDSDARCRKEALHAFALIETDATRLVPLLAAALADKSAIPRWEALQIIPVIGKTAIPLADQLVGLLARADLDAAELRGAEQRLFAPRLIDLEVGRVLKAIEVIGLQNGKQCDLLGDLLIRGKGRMNADIRSGISALLTEAGALAHPAIERWVSATQDADDETQIAALLAAFRIKPPIKNLPPTAIDRALALGRKLVPERPKNPEGEFRETPPLEMAAVALVYMVTAAHLSDVARRDEASRERAIACTYRMEDADPAPAIDWLIEQLADKELKQRWQVAMALGKIGPKAIAAVPALQTIVDGFEYSRYSEEENPVNFVQECYLALARITQDTDRWIKQSEERLLRPMLKEQPRQYRSVVGYLVMITDMGVPAVPHLARWMSGEDANLAYQTMESVIVHGTYDSPMAAAALPEILKNRRHFDVNNHYEFASFVANAGPAGAAAVDILIGCVETYRRQTTDPAELEKLRQTRWSRYSSFAESRIAELLAAFRAIGRAEAQKTVPVLLALYEEEPMKNESFSNRIPVRSDILDTLNALGADLRPLAAKRVPQLIAPLETEYEVRENILELGAFGNLASPAVAELIRYARLRRSFDKEALEALGKIAPDDVRVKAMRHVAKFAPE